jgi:hypothetical protein
MIWVCDAPYLGRICRCCKDEPGLNASPGPCAHGHAGYWRPTDDPGECERWMSPPPPGGRPC